MTAMLQQVPAFVDEGDMDTAAPMVYDNCTLKPATTKASWHIVPSKGASATVNPIRRIFDNIKTKPNPLKSPISVIVGDPTVFGNLGPSKEMLEAMVKSVTDGHFNGYNPSFGLQSAREAVCELMANYGDKLKPEDVILSSGCSHALDMCIASLANPGQNILCPHPGFSVYKTLAATFGIAIKHYELVPTRQWEIDLHSLQAQIDSNTVAIVVCNPSNPCGSVFSRKHMCDIIKVAEKHSLPLIADEVYFDMVFDGVKWYSFSSLSEHVPVLSCKAISKRYLVPGWRLGWVEIHDRHEALKDIRGALVNLSQRIVGPNAIVQGALPDILLKTPPEFFANTMQLIQHNAEIAFNLIKEAPGLWPIMPQGAMYMMIAIDIERFPKFADDMKFTEALIAEQSVLTMPAQSFEYVNYFRIVLTLPMPKLLEACQRILEFCQRNYDALRPRLGYFTPQLYKDNFDVAMRI